MEGYRSLAIDYLGEDMLHLISCYNDNDVTFLLQDPDVRLFNAKHIKVNTRSIEYIKFTRGLLFNKFELYPSNSKWKPL